MRINDGSHEAPKLRVYLNLANLAELPSGSCGPCPGDPGLMERLAADGFEGVQLTTPDAAPAGCLPYCGLGRINRPGDADELAARHRDRGDLCLTVHAGWGIEEDDEVFALAEAILQASSRHGIPIFLETHRATITQDMWRTVQIVKRYPEIGINGDFSHYYCGQEMVYGGLDMKLDFLEPVFRRVGFLHGRVASPGCMQVPVGPDPGGRPPMAHGVADYLADFCEIWLRAMRGFHSSAGPGDVLVFAPELLSWAHYYARLFRAPDGALVEESDRYAEALVYARLARDLFSRAAL